MMLDTVQAIVALAGSGLLVILLLRILLLVHTQTQKVRDLEQRMKLMEERKADGKESIL